MKELKRSRGWQDFVLRDFTCNMGWTSEYHTEEQSCQACLQEVQENPAVYCIFPTMHHALHAMWRVAFSCYFRQVLKRNSWEDEKKKKVSRAALLRILTGPQKNTQRNAAVNPPFRWWKTKCILHLFRRWFLGSLGISWVMKLLDQICSGGVYFPKANWELLRLKRAFLSYAQVRAVSHIAAFSTDSQSRSRIALQLHYLSRYSVVCAVL